MKARSRKANPVAETQLVQDVFGRPLRDLRVSVTDRCNFRCTYCMPAEIYGERFQFLQRAEILDYEEIARLVKIFVKQGVSRVRLTGGEPLVRKHLERLIAMLGDISGIEDLSLTTNGYLLADKARAMRDAGLHRITVSLDTLDDKIFREMNGHRAGTTSVLDGIRAAEDAGFTPIKINAVVQKGVNDHTIVDMARYFKDRGHIVRFIEYMDVGNRNGWKLDSVVPSREIIHLLNQELPLEPLQKSFNSEVADRYRYVDGFGEVGVISSVTQPFCGDCTRLRVSADGKIYTCLFATVGHDVKTTMRDGATDDALEALIKGIWSARTDRYSEERASLTEPIARKVEMYQVGG
jgi:cyclic pyranopterin phosphate synthase